MKKLGKVYILGDSYSTFENCIPKEYDTWYSSAVEEKTDVHTKKDTWWYQLLKNTKSNLILNDSFSGTTICHITYNGVYCPDTSFTERFGKRIEEGIFKNNIPDTFFLFGGTNDSWVDSLEYFIILLSVCQIWYYISIAQTADHSWFNPYNNSVMESFFKSLKTEKLYRTDFRSKKEFRTAVKEYISFYNEKWPHSVLRYRTPNKCEEEYIRRQAALQNI